MTKNSFKEEDKQKLIDFLNMVATHAEFTFNTEQTIKYYGLLAHMQTVMIPKVNANILEVLRVVEAKEAKVEQKKASTKVSTKAK